MAASEEALRRKRWGDAGRRGRQGSGRDHYFSWLVLGILATTSSAQRLLLAQVLRKPLEAFEIEP